MVVKLRRSWIIGAAFGMTSVVFVVQWSILYRSERHRSKLDGELMNIHNGLREVQIYQDASQGETKWEFYRKEENMRQLLEWSMKEFGNRNQRTLPKLLHVRVPKAQDTQMSMIARRIVGLDPPGPCCRSSGEEYGCPLPLAGGAKLPMCDRFEISPEWQNENVPKISTVRYPQQRYLSSFTAGYPHRPEECNPMKFAKTTLDVNQCFIRMTQYASFNNIMIKMLSGVRAYSSSRVCEKNEDGCVASLEVAKRNLCSGKFAWIGIAEAWGTSLILLYDTFPGLRPHPFDFLVYDDDAVRKYGDVMMDQGRTWTVERENDRRLQIERHRVQNSVKSSALRIMRRKNVLEFELYFFVAKIFCHRLWKKGYLNNVYIRREIGRSPFGGMCFRLKRESGTFDTSPLSESMDVDQDLWILSLG